MDYLENKFNFNFPTELNMYYCGKRINTYNHRYGPAVRSHFLIVYIKDGKGTLECNNKIYKLGANNLLTMFPNEKVYYKANENTPWTIQWIGVYGDLVSKYLNILGICIENPVYKVTNTLEIENVLQEIFEISLKDDLNFKIYCISLVHKFFSILTENTVKRKSKYDYISEAKSFIQLHYEQSLTMTEIANTLNIEKSYFTKLFKRETGYTPIEWIINLRIKKACTLLKNTDLSIKEVAYSVGIFDQLYFSRLFKKRMGVPPSNY